MSRFSAAHRGQPAGGERSRGAGSPMQQTVNEALSAFVAAAQKDDGPGMKAALVIVRNASEQQVQRAMLHVQRAGEISRRELLALLAG